MDVAEAHVVREVILQQLKAVAVPLEEDDLPAGQRLAGEDRPADRQPELSIDAETHLLGGAVRGPQVTLVREGVDTSRLVDRLPQRLGALLVDRAVGGEILVKALGPEDQVIERHRMPAVAVETSLLFIPVGVQGLEKRFIVRRFVTEQTVRSQRHQGRQEQKHGHRHAAGLLRLVHCRGFSYGIETFVWNNLLGVNRAV